MCGEPAPLRSGLRSTYTVLESLSGRSQDHTTSWCRWSFQIHLGLPQQVAHPACMALYLLVQHNRLRPVHVYLYLPHHYLPIVHSMTALKCSITWPMTIASPWSEMQHIMMCEPLDVILSLGVLAEAMWGVMKDLTHHQHYFLFSLSFSSVPDLFFL